VTGTQSVVVRFAPDGVPNPAALAAHAITGVLLQCRAKHCDPVGLVSAAVGPCGQLVELFDQLKGTAAAGDAATIANEDQVRATFENEPDRFAALAFAWVTPREEE
jgi:hypothetical protein